MACSTREPPLEIFFSTVADNFLILDVRETILCCVEIQVVDVSTVVALLEL